MDDLITWLRAQLDDDERVARECPHEHWDISRPPGFPVTLCGKISRTGAAFLALGERLNDPKGAALDHAARWDPARVLAEVKAKRRVIDVLRGYEPNDEWDTEPDMGLRRNNAAGALRALAQPYAGRAGWREEWQVSAAT